MVKTSSMAVASLVLGIVSIILGLIPVIGWVFVVLAIIFGILGIKEIEKNRQITGKGMAIAGLIMGVVMGIIKILFIILIAAGLMAGLSLFKFGTSNEIRDVEQNIASESGVGSLDVEIDFGAGDLDIMSGSNDYFLNSILRTTDTQNPSLSYEDDKITMSRDSEEFYFGKQTFEWDVELSPDIEYDLELNYGAAKANVDLKGLKVNSLDISSGATETEIIFSDYPTSVDIGTGASSYNLKFPSGVGVVIDIDGGAVGIDLDDFIEKNEKYYSEDYTEDGDNIVINIEAGASSIDGDFY